jgi:uncharacterized integral membrane protein
MQLWLIMAIVIAILAVFFALQNAIPITVSFLTWKFESSLALVLLITIALGVLMSLLVSVPSKIKKMKMILNQKKRIQELESALQFENDVKEKKVENLEPELPLK